MKKDSKREPDTKHHAAGAMRWLEVVEAVAGVNVSTLLHHRVAATHTERLSGDVAGAIRGKKSHGLSDVFRGAKLAERIQPDNAGFQLWGQPLGGGWRLGKTRTDAINVN